MLPVLSSLYAEWRVQSGVVPILHEDTESPPERLLQAVWQHQRLRRDQLLTLDGEPVRILHPGFLSRESGPDFRGAVVQFAQGVPQTGDIEVDLRSSGWRAHGHDRNPAFRQVILHVVWESERPAPGGPPVLLLRGALDAPLGELSVWLGGESSATLPESMRGRCSAAFGALSGGQLRDLLHQSAQVRLQSKAAQIQARARQVGWEQALWEGVFRALGYKQNVWPMQRLGELRPRWSSASPEPFTLQCRLFGISGLLPVELSRTQAGADRYLCRLWDQWWRERDAFADCLLPRELWRLHGLRPANQPPRRLALASRWAAANRLAGQLEKWCAQSVPDTALAVSLLELLQVEPDDFWSWHCTFRSPRLKKPQPLLGLTRVTDLAVNVILPWLWVRAAEGKNEAVRQTIQHRYEAWPAAEDNALLRQARQRLLGGAARRTLSGAAAQQGLIQIVRDFCEHSNALCEKCQLPELVQATGITSALG